MLVLTCAGRNGFKSESVRVETTVEKRDACSHASQRRNAHVYRELSMQLATLDGDDIWQGFRKGLSGTIKRFQTRSEQGEVLGAASAEPPPGQPIGSGFLSLDRFDDCSWSLN